MRLSLRFIIPLLLALGVVAWAVRPLVDRLTLTWFVRDLDLRATLIANTVQEPVQELVLGNFRTRVLQLFTRITQDERLYAMGFCASPESRPWATVTLSPEISCDSLDAFAGPSGHLLERAQGPLLVSVRPLVAEGAPQGKLVIVQDMSFVQRRSEQTRTYLFYFFVGLGATVSLITVVIAQLSWRGWVHGLRALVRGEGLWRPSDKPHPAELRPVARDLRELIRELQSDHRARDDDPLAWTPETLRAILHGDLRGQEVIVVSNREPYIHVRQDGAIATQRPASGLVTALEPIMRACSGTWIAHGSGSADREVVDRHDRVGIPHERPAYQLRRVWLSPEEEAGYYYGFANEGLWPLCHIAHVRPTFRSSDWEQYRKVNRMFARAVEQESKSPDPIVLVQDYHFALLPRMIHEELPDATVITFWHIPWPNPEAFGICPWREELLDGLLGSSILGFHTQFHCNNFVDTVDRLLEARADREMFTVTYRGKLTAVKRYPISIEWPPSAELVARPVEQCHRDVRARHGLPPDHAIGVGVDRLDYTKGIEERFRAVERLLEMQPEWVGKFTFIQIGAPTRAIIEQYQEYEARVRAMADRINARFSHASHPPILLKVAHHEPQDVYEYYRAAELCVVSSLHDGMNLVAKEFVAARDDERGVLILSQFTGAARELPEALVVNPYDTDQCAAALHQALSMPVSEQRTRIRLMRGLIQEFNVYRWAGRMLIHAAGMRRRGRLLERAVSPATWVRTLAGNDAGRDT
ncbi:MAG TPA: trehalose-6-phosphate synthase [Gemmatimonadaceae bacterium]|nr:trehalose-6-phosphate synthase [Gemmatimonadaceae bacterium]